MKKIFGFFKRLWGLITGKEVRPFVEDEVVVKPLLGGSSYDIEIDYTDVYDMLVRCKTVKGLQKECKVLGITINTDITNFPGDKTIQLKAKHLYELLKVYSQGVLQKYTTLVTRKVQDTLPLRDRRIKDLRLQGLKYDFEIDYVDIYNCILNCKTHDGLQKECKERGVYLNTDVTHISPYKTIQLKCEELSSLLKTYANGSKEQYDKLLETKIEEFELLKNKRIEDLNAIGLCCPKCFSKQKKYYTGLIEIKSHDGFYSPLGGGVAVGGDGLTQYQFHYKKCLKCGHWEMFEYRIVPHWWDDLFDIDCPFKKGNIIEEYMNDKIPKEKYISHEILHW